MANLDVKLTPVDQDPGAVVAELTGVIEQSTVSRFQEALEDLAQRDVQKVILDMSRVRYVNSTGLGALVQYRDKFKAAGGGMALIRVTAKVRIVIEMLGLDAFFEICADESEALAAIDSAAGPAAAPAAAAPTSAQPQAQAEAPPEATPQAGGASRGDAPPPPRDADAPQPSAPRSAPTELAGEPRTVSCKACSVDIEVPGDGSWRCPRCRTLLEARPDGTVEFLAPAGPPPFELSLACTREGTEGLVQFVDAVTRPVLNGSQKVEMLKAAVGEVCQVIASAAYDWDTSEVYQVAVEARPGEVRVRFADHGRALEQERLQSYFPHATRIADAFDLRPHPRGGNIISLTLRA